MSFDDFASVGVEDNRGGPSVVFVAIRQVGSRVLIDTDGDVSRAEESNHFRIPIRDLLHHVAPVAPARTKIEENESVLFASACKDLLGPRLPVNGLLGLRRSKMKP